MIKTVHEIGLIIVKQEIEKYQKQLLGIDVDIKDLQVKKEYISQQLQEHLLILELDEKETTHE